MSYTESSGRKIVMVIAWMVGAAIGGLGVFYFSSGSVEQTQITEKKKVRTKQSARRTRISHKRAKVAALATQQKSLTESGMATATFALG